MTELITYRGGSCGDFLKVLLSNCDFELDETGKVHTPNTFDYTRATRELVELGEDIDTIVKKCIRYKERHSNNKNLDYITSHDFPVFVERYNSGIEFFDYVEKLSINRVLFISITTEKSLKFRTLNSLIKSHNKTYDDYIKHYNRYGKTQLELYKKDVEIFNNYKRECDITLELEHIYDKEYLRNFLMENYSWSDDNYDTVYDYYMSKQKKL